MKSIALLIILFSLPSLVLAQPKHVNVSAVTNHSTVKRGQDAVIAVVFDIRKGFHSQSANPGNENAIPFVLTAQEADRIKLGKPVYPKGHDETYADGSKANVYSGRTVVYLPISVASDAKPGLVKIAGQVDFQICDDKGVCFPPGQAKWALEMAVGEKSVPANEEEFKAYKPGMTGSERATTPTTRKAPAAASGLIPWVPFSESLLNDLRGSGTRVSGAPPVVAEEKRNWNTITALGVAFLVGLIFNIMPCVLPVLPLKAMGFYEVAQHHRGKTMLLAGAFSLGIILVFAALSLLVVVFAVIGWSQLIAKAWFAWTIVGILAVMGIGMFGFFTVNLPSSVYQFTPRHDTYFGNFLFGILAALLSTPCTAPLLPAVMAWAAAQPVALGVLAMVTVGIGMAFPYLVLSAFPELARKFPRVGPWSELFKHMMGWLLIASAVFFAAGRLFHSNAFWWSLAPVAVIASVYLMVKTLKITHKLRPVLISSAIVLLMTGSTVFIAAYMTGAFTSSRGATGAGAGWDPVASAGNGKPNIVLVKFTAHWCLNCQTIEATVFHEQRTADALRNLGVVPVKADLTQEGAAGWPTLRGIEPSGGIPVTAIYVPGYEQPIKLTSVYSTDKLLDVLKQVQNLPQVAVTAR